MVIAVLHCHRPTGATYIDKTLESLDVEGAENYERFVFTDGGKPFVRSGWRNYGTEKNNGDFHATWRAFAIAVKDFPGEDLLIFEDDVLACKNAVLACDTLKVPDGFAFLSFFNNPDRFTKEQPKGAPAQIHDWRGTRFDRSKPVVPGIYKYKLRGTFTYSQAVKIPWDTVRRIAEIGEPAGWRANLINQMADKNYRGVNHPHVATGNGRDMAIGHQCTTLGFPWYGQVAPNWFEHTGMISAAVYGATLSGHITKERPLAANWEGVEHDAFADLKNLSVKPTWDS